MSLLVQLHCQLSQETLTSITPLGLPHSPHLLQNASRLAMCDSYDSYYYYHYMSRNKVSSQLPIPSCGGRGVPSSAFYLAWLAGEVIRRNELYYYNNVPGGGLGGGVYWGKGFARCSEVTCRSTTNFLPAAV